MSGTDPRLLGRIQAPAGAAVLALTAADWLVKSESSPIGQLRQEHSLWGMLDVVNPHIVGLAYVAVFVIVGFSVGCLVLVRAPLAVIVLAVLSTIATVSIMLSTDGGFSPGAGAWLTAFVSFGVAIAGCEQIVRGGRPAYTRGPGQHAPGVANS